MTVEERQKKIQESCTILNTMPITFELVQFGYVDPEQPDVPKTAWTIVAHATVGGEKVSVNVIGATWMPLDTPEKAMGKLERQFGLFPLL